MLPDGQGWDVAKVLLLFDRLTAEKFLSIPISSGRGENFRVWHFNFNGLYTVKSGYWVAFDSFSPITETSSSLCLDQVLWKWIWNLKVPPKVQNFMWRLCFNALPSMKNLFRRRASPSASCQICGHPEESIEHIFLLCPWTQPIWFGSMFQWIVDDLSVQRMDVWVWQKLKLIREAWGNWKDNQALFMSICWEIWKRRNFFYFEQAKVNPLAVLHLALEKFAEFFKCGSVSLVPPPLPSYVVPNHPSFVRNWNEQGWFRVNVDAALQDSSSLCATYFLLRDDHGALLTGFSQKFWSHSPLVAEALALRESMYACVNLELVKVNFESDCKAILDAVYQEDTPWSIEDIMADIKHMLRANASFAVYWIPCSLNSPADWVAQATLRNSLTPLWTSCPPPDLRSLLLADRIFPSKVWALLIVYPRPVRPSLCPRHVSQNHPEAMACRMMKKWWWWWCEWVSQGRWRSRRSRAMPPAPDSTGCGGAPRRRRPLWWRHTRISPHGIARRRDSESNRRRGIVRGMKGLLLVEMGLRRLAELRLRLGWAERESWGRECRGRRRRMGIEEGKT
ncbi:reverse transcriptase [Senna tora]|uniref:Reverse transcriptase n=1 Tax=Senna tora TaxID=362788 RepID=A0A834WXX1_9FABA|nr:reverse transcriptase [Senna tora]